MNQDVATNGGGVATAPARPRRREGTRPTLPRGQRKVRQDRATPASQVLNPRLAWYAGLALIAVLEVIEWPVALVVAIGHEIAYRARTRAVRELAEGIEAAG